MAKKSSHIALIGVLLVSACLKASVANWMSDLTKNINQQVQQLTHNIETQVQDALQPALAEANRAIENLPRGTSGQLLSSGNSIIISDENGVAKFTLSRKTPAGEPYIRKIKEYSKENFLYHMETIYYPKTNTNVTFNWKLDFTTPGVKPELITDEN